MQSQGQSSAVPGSVEQPLFSESFGKGTMVFGVVIVIVAVGMLVGAVPAFASGEYLGAGILLSVAGILGGFFGVAIFRLGGREDRWYPNRAERWHKGQLVRTVSFDDPTLRYTFAFQPGGGGVTMSVNDGNGGSSLSASAGPKVTEAQLEAIRDQLQQRVEQNIVNALSAGQTYKVDDKWHLQPDGVQINGQLLPWDRLAIRCSNTTGEIQFMLNGKKVASRSLIEDNAIAASTIMIANAAEGGWD